MIYKILWKLFNKGLLPYMVKSQNKEYKFTELEYRFIDSNGKKYYGFPDNISLPEDRWSQLQDFLTWLSNGLTAETLTKLISKAEKAIEDGIVKMADSKRPNAIKIAAILNEIKTRQDMIRPNELLYNIIAVQLIREDEDPLVFNNNIHREKVDQFEFERLEGNNFFLQLREFVTVWSFQKMS